MSDTVRFDRVQHESSRLTHRKRSQVPDTIKQVPDTGPTRLSQFCLGLGFIDESDRTRPDTIYKSPPNPSLPQIDPDLSLTSSEKKKPRLLVIDRGGGLVVAVV